MSQQTSTGASAAVEAPGRKQFAIGFMLCVGVCAGWYFGVRPLEQKFKNTKAELGAVHKHLSEFEELRQSEPPLTKVIESLNTQGVRTNLATELSGNATRLYDAVHDLAKSHSVRLARIEPSSNRGGGAITPSKGAFKGAETFGYSLEVGGTYESVCRFIDACEQSLGVSKVTSFHLSPQTVGSASSDPMITAVIETSHLKLQIPNVVAPKAPAQASATEETGS